MDQLDTLIQRCHDLEAKVRLTEEERDSLVNENEDLFNRISALGSKIEGHETKMNPHEQEVNLIIDEISRLDSSFRSIQSVITGMSDKIKEMSTIRESVQFALEETKEVKDDVSLLKVTLQSAAKPDSQGGTGSFDLRLRQVEDLLIKFAQQEAGLQYILEETKLLKDQVDSLKENTYERKQDNCAQDFCTNVAALGIEMQEGTPISLASSRHISMDNNDNEEPEFHYPVTLSVTTQTDFAPETEKEIVPDILDSAKDPSACHELVHMVINMFL
ncbi:hypothetical protein TCAL_03157 [Tigriopus californicus]|uniref:Uncharacterized protein n=1 Tax=Tigriopus californicus TaxID=6832 RepID=A0A553P2G0_TIGCA|nr:protein Hook homolog 1-like [Tigriopus californicus]TRY71863.1 hypothetical protein TCAL_03157 [Tigriopus californicus]